MTLKDRIDSVKPLVLNAALAREFRENPEVLAKTLIAALHDEEGPASMEDLAMILHDVILFAYLEGFVAGRKRGN